ncbi:VENN motif pre-toxin domain-containing protein [Neisseria sp. Marseille-Q6792]
MIASLTGAAIGGTPVDAQTGGAVGQNGVENNLVGISCVVLTDFSHTH